MKVEMNISESIRYIGVDDLDLDLFESQYPVPQGMAYNSWVILDDKVAIMDTSDGRKATEWKENLKAALQGRTPDYLVCHHMEPDHASLIAEVMECYPAMQVVASVQALKMLPNFFASADFTGRTQVVKEGDTLSLGQHTLQFIGAPMVHWPEVLMSYELSEKVLFSADGFGKFGAIVHETEDWKTEARRYYFNICGKYGAQVYNVLKKAATLDITTLCALHGPVLRGEQLAQAVQLYSTWSQYEAEGDGVLVAYASIHGGTRAVAEKVGELLRQKGAAEVVVRDLSRSDMSEVLSEAFFYPRVVLASATYDGGVFPVMHDFLHHLQIKNYQNRRFALIENGSWAPVAGKIMRCMVESLKNCEVVEPMVTIRSRMHADNVPQLEALADALLQ